MEYLIENTNPYEISLSRVEIRYGTMTEITMASFLGGGGWGGHLFRGAIGAEIHWFIQTHFVGFHRTVRTFELVVFEEHFLWCVV